MKEVFFVNKKYKDTFTPYFPYKNNIGFTLIEVLVTLVILVGVFSMGTAFFKRKESAVKKTFRQFTAINRQLDHSARLKRKIWRIVVQISDKNSSWWVEKKLSNEEINSIPSSEQKDIISSDGFVMDDAFFEEAQTLPRWLNFNSLESSNVKKPITEGKAYIYYFPEGQFNLSLLKLKGKKAYWSLLFDRLRGDLVIYNEDKKLKDLQP